MPAIVDINTQGDADLVAPFIYQSTDLAGSVLKMMVRSKPEDAQAWISIGSAATGGIEITSSTDTVLAFTITLPRARLAVMPPGQYVHSLVCVKSSGIYETVWSGTITHVAGIVR